MQLIHGDCLEVMRELPDNSVDLISTDPPYFKVKGEAWDNQWDTADGFLTWLDTILEQFQRILKSNGSLYLFASPKMAARVEVLIGKRFNVLNTIRWMKEAGWHKKTDKEMIRSYLSPWEACIFAEHYEQPYDDVCRELHKEVYSSVGNYLKSERERSGYTRNDIELSLGYVSGTDPTRGTSLCYRWEEGSSLPTERDYLRYRKLLNNGSSEYLKRDYQDIRAEYDGLWQVYDRERQQYEELRRPFSASADVPFTDVWTFKTVSHYKGKHPCEKPADMLEHIISTSSKPGAVVLDAFMGTGSTGLACKKLGREFIGVEMNDKYFQQATTSLQGYQLSLPLDGDK